MFYDSASCTAIPTVFSQSIHQPRQERPGLRFNDPVLRGVQHAAHHPLSVP